MFPKVGETSMSIGGCEVGDWREPRLVADLTGHQLSRHARNHNTSRSARCLGETRKVSLVSRHTHSIHREPYTFWPDPAILLDKHAYGHATFYTKDTAALFSANQAFLLIKPLKKSKLLASLCN